MRALITGSDEPLDVRGTPESGAIFSRCGTYRYVLWRWWGDGPAMLWSGHNPSEADELDLDPTMTRIKGYTERGIPGHKPYGGLLMLNLGAYKSTDPKGLSKLTLEEAVGPQNLRIWELVLSQAPDSPLVMAWGVPHKVLRPQDEVLRDLLYNKYKRKPLCLTKTKDGYPGHPLYLKSSLYPKEYADV